MNSPAVDVFKPGNKTKERWFYRSQRAKRGVKLTVIDGQIQITEITVFPSAFANSRQLHQRRKRTRLYIQF